MAQYSDGSGGVAQRQSGPQGQVASSNLATPDPSFLVGMNVNTTDESLVRESLAGNPEAFCALARRYQDHAYGVALGVLADVHLALDAAQEALLSAYCDLAKLRDPARFAPWLCGIARNTAFEIRRQRDRQQSLARQVAGQAALVALPTDQLIAEDEEQAAVREALLRVKDRDREALTLYYADGRLGYREVSRFLGISIGALKGRLQRGRAALRKELEMVERRCREHAPDDAFARSLERAIRVFAAKGPAVNHIPSEWHDSLNSETKRILDAGDDGFRIDLALSHAGSRRQRCMAAIRLGLRRDARSLRELERLLEDRAPRVRCAAVTWYAAGIHPGNAAERMGPIEARTAATSTPPGLDRLLARMNDESFNVRAAALQVLSAYRVTGAPRVTHALEAALDDPKHKVRHAAARIVGVPCRGCGKTWQATKG